MLFKSRYVDFVVEENLPYSLSKEHTPKTPWFYVKIEKRNINTMDLLKQIMKATWLPRKKIGIAWLKDKHALARQWMCFHTGDVSKLGDAKFIKLIQEITKVVDFWFSDKVLNISSNITNSFWVRLRKDAKNQEKKSIIAHENDPRSKGKGLEKSNYKKGEDISNDFLEVRLKKLYTEWFLNLYGEQRFGYTHANHRIAQEIIAGNKKWLDKYEIIFKLQSLASWYFNNYCTYRETKYGNKILEGDVFANDNAALGIQARDEAKTERREQMWKEAGTDVPVRLKNFVKEPTAKSEDPDVRKVSTIPTWPLIGDDLQLADPSTEAGKLEAEWMEHFEINDELLAVYKKHGIFWLRRPIRVKPTKASHQRQWDDLLLQFTLPKGSYASVLVEELLWE